MKDVSFEKAPLVELIAELRWNPPGVVAAGAGPAGVAQFAVALGRDVEEFFQHFGNEVNKAGFTTAEKIVPAGFPAFLHQPVWRFRKPDDNSTLLQVGPGLLSANALRPYRRWKNFRPTVEVGVNAMLKTRPLAERELHFSSASVRYINAFSGELLAGQAPAAFIKDVLGVNIALPLAVERLIDQQKTVNSNASLLIPIANMSKVMSLTIGDGAVGGETGAVLDVTVAETAKIESKSVDVMRALDTSRNVIHECFIELTAAIRHRMMPKED